MIHHQGSFKQDWPLPFDQRSHQVHALCSIFHPKLAHDSAEASGSTRSGDASSSTAPNITNSSWPQPTSLRRSWPWFSAVASQSWQQGDLQRRVTCNHMHITLIYVYGFIVCIKLTKTIMQCDAICLYVWMWKYKFYSYTYMIYTSSIYKTIIL